MESDSQQDPEDLLFTDDPDAEGSPSVMSTGEDDGFSQIAAPKEWQSDDDDWAPPADDSDSGAFENLPSLMDNHQEIEEPVSRNLLPPDQPSDLGSTPPADPGQRDPAVPPKKKMQIIPPAAAAAPVEGPAAGPVEADQAETSGTEAKPTRSGRRGAEVIIKGKVRTPVLGASAPAARPSAVVIPVMVLVMGAGLAGFLSATMSDHIMAGIALGLSVVGALLLRVFLRG